jgi:hypothetical protein
LALRRQLDESLNDIAKLRISFDCHAEKVAGVGVHNAALQKKLDSLEADLAELKETSRADNAGSAPLLEQLDKQIKATVSLAQQSPKTLFRLRAIEIVLPLVLSIFSLTLTFRYPLSESRVYEIKAELERRRRNDNG